MKKKIINFRVSDKQFVEIEALSKKLNMDISEYIRFVLKNEWLKSQ